MVMGVSKMVGLYWKHPFKWMIWRYPHFRKPSCMFMISMSLSTFFLNIVDGRNPAAVGRCLFHAARIPLQSQCFIKVPISLSSQFFGSFFPCFYCTALPRLEFINLAFAICFRIGGVRKGGRGFVDVADLILKCVCVLKIGGLIWRKLPYHGRQTTWNTMIRIRSPILL